MKRPLALGTVIALVRASSLAQGCSDAGVCTAGSLGDIDLSGDVGSVGFDHRSDVRVLFSYAVGEENTVITQLIPEVNFMIGGRVRLQLRAPYMWISGNLGENSGVGDPTITASYAFINEDPRRLEGFIGTKLNLNEASAVASNTRPLPMPYQTSLGTKDMLLGVNYRRQFFQAGLAYQHVLVHENDNGFLHLAWMDNADAQVYFESAGLIRADDVVMRMQYLFGFRKLVVQPGLLAIYHLVEDERIMVDALGMRTTRVEGSDGLTLNITADARYKLSDHWNLEASFGSPVIVREARPDGLTRHFVLNLGARFAF